MGKYQSLGAYSFYKVRMKWKQLEGLSIKSIRAYFLVEKPRCFLGNYFHGLGLSSVIVYAQQKGRA